MTVYVRHSCWCSNYLVSLFENSGLVKNSNFEKMVEISKNALIKSEIVATKKSYPRVAQSSFKQTSPHKSQSQLNEHDDGSRGSRQYINPRSRSRDGSFGRKLLNNNPTQLTDSSNRSLRNFYKRTANKGPQSNQVLQDSSLNFEEILEKLGKVEECLSKYKKLCPPGTYESKLQSQILEFDLRNLRQILEKKSQATKLLPVDAFVSSGVKNSVQNLNQNQGRRNERNRSLPHNETKFEHHLAQEPYFTKVQPEGDDLELKKIILQLGKDKKQLERKCEDRKVSLKKLYFIVTEKDKQLRKACSALEYCGNRVEEFEELLESQSKKYMIQIDALTARLHNIIPLLSSIQDVQALRAIDNAPKSGTQNLESFKKVENSSKGSKLEQLVSQDRVKIAAFLEQRIAPHAQNLSKVNKNKISEPLDILQEFHENYSKLLNQQADLEQQNRILSQTIIELKNELDQGGIQMISVKKDLEKELTLKTQALEKSDHKISVLQEQLILLQKGISEKKAEFQNEKSGLQKRIDQLEKIGLEVQNEVVLQLEREKTLLKEELSAANVAQNDLEARMKEEKRNFMSQQENTQQSYSDLISQLEEHVSELRQDLLNKKKENAEMKKSMISAQESAEEKDQCIQELTIRLQNVSFEFEQLQKKVQTDSEQAAEFLLENEKLREVLEINDSKLDKLRSQLSQAQSELATRPAAQSQKEEKLIEDLEQTQVQLELARNENSNLEHEVEELLQVVSNLESAQKKHENTVSDLQEIKHELKLKLESTNQQTEEEIQRIEFEKQELSLALREAEEKLLSCKKDYEKLLVNQEDLIKQLGEKNQDIQNQLNALQTAKALVDDNERQQIAEQLRFAEQKLAENDVIAGKLRLELESCKNAEESMKKEIAALKVARDEFDRIKDQEVAVNKLLESAQSKSDEIEKQNSELKNDYLILQQQMGDLQAKFDQIEAERTLAKDEIEVLKQNSISFQQEINNLENERTNQEGNLAQANQLVDKLKRENHELLADMKNKFGDRSELIERIRIQSFEADELKSQLMEEQNTRSLLEEQVGSLSEKYEDVLDEISARQEEIVEMNIVIDKLRISLEETQKKNEDSSIVLAKETLAAKDRITQLEKLLQEHEEKASNLNYDYEDQLSKCKELEAQIEDLESEQVNLQKDIETKKLSIGSLEGVIRELEQLVKQKDACISDREQELKDVKFVQKIAERRQDDLEQQVDSLNRKIVTLMSDETMAKNLIEEKIRIIRRFQNREQKLISQAKSLSTEVEGITKSAIDVNQYQPIIESLKLKDAQQCGEIQSLVLKLAENQGKILDFETKLRDAELLLEAENSQFEDASKKMEILKNSLEAAETELIFVRSQAQEKDQELEKIRAEFEGISASKKEIDHENDSLVKKLSEFEDTLRGQLERLHDAEEMNRSMQMLAKSNEEKLQNLTSEIELKNLIIEEFKAQINSDKSIDQQIQSLRAENQALQLNGAKAIEAMKKENAGRLADLELSHSSTLSELETLKCQIREKNFTLEQRDLQISEMKNGIKDQTNKLNDEALKIKERSLQEVTSLQNQIIAQIRDIEDSKAQNVILEEQVASLSNDIVKLNQQVTETMELIEENEKTIEEYELAIEDLTEKLQSRDKQIDQLEDDLQRANQQLETLNSSIGDKESQIPVLVQQIGIKDKEIAQMRGIMSEQDSTLIDLEKQISQLASSNLEFQHTIEALNLQIDLRLEEISGMKDSLDEQSQSKSEYQLQIVKLKKSVEDLESLNTELSIQNSQLDETNRELLTQLETQNSENLQLKESRVLLNRELQDLQKTSEKLQDDIADYENKFLLTEKAEKKLLIELKQKDSQIVELTEKLDLASSLTDQLQKKVQKLTHKLDNEKGSLEKQEDVRSSLQETILLLNSEIDLNKSKVISLEKQLLVANSSLQALEQRIVDKNESSITSQKNYERELEMSSSASKKSQEQLIEAKAELKHVSSEFDKAKTYLMELEKEKISLKTLVDQTKETLQRKELDFENLRAKYEALVSSNSQIAESGVNLGDKLLQLTSQNTELKIVLEHKAKELELAALALQQMNRDKDSTIAELETRLGDLHSSNTSDINQRFEDVEVKLDAKISKIVKDKQHMEGKLSELNQEVNHLLWQNLVLRKSRAEINRRYFNAVLALTRSQKIQQSNQILKKENDQLGDQLYKQTQKLIDLESRRSEIEDQLAFRENQLEEVICSQTLRTEVDDTTSRVSGNQTSNSQAAESHFRTLKQHYKSLVFMIKNFYVFEVPPLENLNDKAWDNFVRNLKKKFVEQKIEYDHLKESIKNYKFLLDQKCIESQEFEEKFLKLKGFVELELSVSEVGHDSFASKLNEFLNDSEVDINNKSLEKAENRPDEHLYEEEEEDELMTLKLQVAQLQREKKEKVADIDEVLEGLRRENDDMRRENEMLVIYVKELEANVKNLENTEEILIQQSQTQKEQIAELKKKVKQSEAVNQSVHIKGSLIQWLNFFSKGNLKESEQLLTLLSSQLGMSAEEKNEMKLFVEGLKPKKKGFFGR